jgi:hypothetical protein
MHTVPCSIQQQIHIALTVARLCPKIFTIIAHNHEGLEMLVDRVPHRGPFYGDSAFRDLGAPIHD